MRRIDDFIKQKNRIQYFDQYFCTRKNLLVQIFWPRILKFSLAFSVNAGLISDPGNVLRVHYRYNVRTDAHTCTKK